MAAMLVVRFFARQAISNSWPRSAWAYSEASLDETIAAAKLLGLQVTARVVRGTQELELPLGSR